MRSPTAADALFAPYRVAEALLLKRVDGAERVAITAVDKYGDIRHLDGTGRPGAGHRHGHRGCDAPPGGPRPPRRATYGA